MSARGWIAVLVVSLAGCGIMDFGVTVQRPPQPRQPPVPSPFKAEEQGPLEATGVEGLFRAPSLGPNVYFHEPEDLWYRYAYRRWYQAFRWNGNWFVLDDPPEMLRGLKIVRPKLPELPELPDFPELPEEEPDPGGGSDEAP